MYGLFHVQLIWEFLQGPPRWVQQAARPRLAPWDEEATPQDVDMMHHLYNIPTRLLHRSQTSHGWADLTSCINLHARHVVESTHHVLEILRLGGHMRHMVCYHCEADCLNQG